MKQLMIALMLSIGISSVVMSFNGQHGQQVEWDELNLTEVQSQQIDLIQENYRKNFQRLRKHDLEKSDLTNRLLSLREDMVLEIGSLLSVQQKLQASAMVIEKVENRINKRFERLAKKLAMTEQQQATIRKLVNNNLGEHQDEILLGSITEIEQHKYMLEQVNLLMPNILSSEQLAQWKKIKDQRFNYLAS